ncbi:MAG: glycosyltransferase family 4 protein [Candidatus Brocadia sp.]|nr:glycosyltransferase family 4 protein [Candidatus Brocadia sp.]
MRILFISQYFTPEIGAASERMSGLTFNLRRLGHKVTVITGFPNYPFGKTYPGYKKKFFSLENNNGVKIIRVWLFTSSATGAVARLLNYLTFMFSSIFAGLWAGRADYTLATSGPLFAALAGYVVSKMKGTPFIFDVRDIWPERIYAGTNMKRGLMIKALEKVEVFLYKKAAKIIAVTEGVKNNIISKGICPEKITVITNGVDTGIFFPRPRNGALAEKLGIGENTFTVTYVGTLGLLQDMSLIVTCAERLKDYKEILFLIVGGGAKRDEFVAVIKKNNLTNVKILPPVSPVELCDYINLANVGINANINHPHNNMAIPVKIFPYMACAKPIILANTGEIARLVERHTVGQCVSPGDAEAFTRAILEFYHDRNLCKQCGENGYNLVREYFSIDRLARSVLSVISGTTQPESNKESNNNLVF